MENQYIKKVISENIIPYIGEVIDIGANDGRDSIFMGKQGYIVTAIENSPKRAAKMMEHPEIARVINKDITEFSIPENTYVFATANNTFPFIQDKEAVKRVIQDVIKGMIGKGVFHFTVFGPNDGWSQEADMSFWTYEEITDFIKSMPVKIYSRSTMEGYGKKMDGTVKYWEIHSFLVQK